MFDSLDLIHMASSLASHASGRQANTARNLANADTPGYRATKLPEFSDMYRGLEQDPLTVTRTTHLAQNSSDFASSRPVDAGGPASPNGNTVSLETEMVRTVEIKREHDVALAVYKSSLDLMRAALGRGR